MKKEHIIILTAAIVLFSCFLYIPHLVNPFPIHVDEWHHITEAIKLSNGVYTLGSGTLEVGFHLFLAMIAQIFDLVLIYKYLVVIWGVFSAITLFCITRSITQDTKEKFLIPLFTILFFMTIKSNVHTLGPWFFVPLTFCIPLIYMYLFLFDRGVQTQNHRYIFYSILIMILLIFTHAISLLAFIPGLLLYSIIEWKQLTKQKWIFALLGGIGAIGVVFFGYVMQTKDILATVLSLFTYIQFPSEWGVFPYTISPFDLYSIVGYLFALVGIYAILRSKSLQHRYAPYWYSLIGLMGMVIGYIVFSVSFFSPYERNVFYLVLLLPFFSARGLMYTLQVCQDKHLCKRIGSIIIILLVFFASFYGYFTITESIRLYQPITTESYDVLVYLSTLEKGLVMAPIGMSMGVYPIAQQEPVATSYFYGNKTIVHLFYNSTSCTEYHNRLPPDVKYILSKKPLSCGWIQIYQQGEIWVYSV